MAAAKALDFDHELARWVVAAPPTVGGLLLAAGARRRARVYERAMTEGRPLPQGLPLTLLGVAVAIYAAAALIAVAVD